MITLIRFSPFLTKLYCVVHIMVSDGEKQGLDICSAITQCLPNFWYNKLEDCGHQGV